MKDLCVNLISCLKEMNRLSRVYIKCGNVFVFALLTATVFCAVSAGKMGNYDNLIFLRDNLFFCFKEMLGAVYVPALLIEIFVLAEKQPL